MTLRELYELGRLTGIIAWKDLPEDYEYEWERVQRLRAEGATIMKGGNYRDVESSPNLGVRLFPYGVGVKKEGYSRGRHVERSNSVWSK
jgi:hypothetical protein